MFVVCFDQLWDAVRTQKLVETWFVFGLLVVGCWLLVVESRKGEPGTIKSLFPQSTLIFNMRGLFEEKLWDHLGNREKLDFRSTKHFLLYKPSIKTSPHQAWEYNSIGKKIHICGKKYSKIIWYLIKFFWGVIVTQTKEHWIIPRAWSNIVIRYSCMARTRKLVEIHNVHAPESLSKYTTLLLN